MTIQPGKDWKFFLFGQHIEALRDDLKRRGVRLTNDPDEADLILPCGGDGTLLCCGRCQCNQLSYGG